MKKILLTLTALLLIAIPLAAADGLLHVQSNHGVKETGDRLMEILNKKGMTIFNRIKHSEAAAKINIPLRETELIIFGNPKVGSLLMQCQQSVAIDLPLKALIWKDETEKIWISYNDPQYLKKRHQITGCETVISTIEKALAGITAAAAGQ